MILAGVAVATRPPFGLTFLNDVRFAHLSRWTKIYELGVRIPFVTALSEELLFRSVLLAVLLAICTTRWAAVWPSIAIGLWHVLTTLDDLAGNAAADSFGAGHSPPTGGHTPHSGVVRYASGGPSRRSPRRPGRSRRTRSPPAGRSRRTPTPDAIDSSAKPLLVLSDLHSPKPRQGAASLVTSLSSQPTRTTGEPKMAMIRSPNGGMKPLETVRRCRFSGVLGGTGGLNSRLENR